MADLSVGGFRGIAPILGNTKLPEGMATTAVNCKLTSQDLQAFNDFGNPFTLSKDPIINTIWRMAGEFWLQWTASEVAYGTNIDAVLGAVVGDTSYRTLLSGLSGGPAFTNLYYATDPSQQGSSVAGAYPYKWFPLGIADPSSAPTATTPTASGVTTTYQYAQEESVNNAVIAAGGTSYKVGDKPTVNGGTLFAGLGPAQVQVVSVDLSTGAVTGIELLEGGFYTNGNGPTSPAATTGGSGTGLTLTLTVVPNSLSGWGYTAYDNGDGSYRTLSIVGDVWYYTSGQGDLNCAYSTQAFGLATASNAVFQADVQTTDSGSGTIPDMIVSLACTYNGVSGSTGAAIVISQLDGEFQLYSGITPTNGGAVTGTLVDSASYAFTTATWFRVVATMTAATNATQAGFSVTVTVAHAATPNTILKTLSGFIPITGDTFCIGTNHRGPHSDGNVGKVENIQIQVTQPNSGVTSEATNYVYTYVQQFQLDAIDTFTQESGPSDPSATITVYTDNTTVPPTKNDVTVVIPACPSNENIAFYNLYRLVLAADGVTETYTFVAQLTANSSAAVTYTDSLLDSQIGPSVLESSDWAPPASNLQGFISAPNGVSAGFFDNVFSPSVQNFPHAYPIDYQLATADPIVAIAALNTTFFILTESNPYTAFGTDPSALAMTKEPAQQGCVSKRSVATHKDFGVIYASGNGLCYYRGSGDMGLLEINVGSTAQPNIRHMKPPFSYSQWQALNPASIIGVVHDDSYFFWYETTGGQKGGYRLDLSSRGGGMTEIDWHVTAPFTYPLDDQLYVVPDLSTFPISGDIVTTPSKVVSQWQYATTLRPYVWARADYLVTHPVALTMARVLADDYDDCALEVFSILNGSVANSAITNELPFVLATREADQRWGVQLSGTSTINLVQAVEDVKEFG